MSPVVGLHLAVGVAAVACGAAALTVRKGSVWHARVGAGFFGSMLVLAATASALAAMQGESPLNGVFVGYFAVTSWMTARRRDGRAGGSEIAACVIALGLAAATTWGALAGTSTTPAGAAPVFVLAAVCALAGALDLSVILRRQLTAVQRISRHLWRMCFAFFAATGSFFLGQQDVLPAPLRGAPVLFILAFAPLALMLFWLVRVRFWKWTTNPAEASPARG